VEYAEITAKSLSHAGNTGSIPFGITKKLTPDFPKTESGVFQFILYDVS